MVHFWENDTEQDVGFGVKNSCSLLQKSIFINHIIKIKLKEVDFYAQEIVFNQHFSVIWQEHM